MRIGFQTWGSDGDIRPFMALAGGLKSAGRDVTLAVTSVDHKDYAKLASSLEQIVNRVIESPSMVHTARLIKGSERRENGVVNAVKTPQKVFD